MDLALEIPLFIPSYPPQEEQKKQITFKQVLQS